MGHEGHFQARFQAIRRRFGARLALRGAGRGSLTESCIPPGRDYPFSMRLRRVLSHIALRILACCYIGAPVVERGERLEATLASDARPSVGLLQLRDDAAHDDDGHDEHQDTRQPKTPTNMAIGATGSVGPAVYPLVMRIPPTDLRALLAPAVVSAPVATPEPPPTKVTSNRSDSRTNVGALASSGCTNVAQDLFP
jgi:hypothetical protein